MSTASDISAYEHSVEASTSEVLFNRKKWTYIQDSTSNTGQYSGQIQLNLSTLSSQAAYFDFSEAVIEIPVKLQFLNASAASVTSTAAATFDQLIPKAGAWQFIDSVQVVVDGVTVQTNQIHENVNCTFKALTEWSQDKLLQDGHTSNFAIDKYEPMQSGTVAQTQSLDNILTSNMINSALGEFGHASTFHNSGARERSKMTTIDQSSGKLAFDVMGGSGNMANVAKPQVWVAPAGAVGVGAPFYVAHYLAVVKLADICDYFKKAPMTKNAKGYIYINYNSSISNLTTNAVGVVTPGGISTVFNNMQFGNTCPVMYNFISANNSTDGTRTGLAVPSGTVLQITADVNGTPNSTANLTPPQAFTRLIVPSYSPNPSADHALVQKKTFRYFERITNRFTALPGQSFTYTITNGVANPKKLVMLPVITNPSTANNATADVINPLRSPFSTVPATTSPFAGIKNLQVTVGNLPCYNTPISFGYDQYLFETAHSGADGGLDSTTTSGLLSQQLWESLYRFVVVDLGRRLPSEDGASKSIIVSGTSNCAYPLTIYYHVWRDAVATVDTSMGTVSQGAVQSS